MFKFHGQIASLQCTTCSEKFSGLRLGLVSFPDHFSPHGKNWSGEPPLPFSFPPPECWRSNQVALRKWRNLWEYWRPRKLSNRGSVQETRLPRTETRLREGCQEFREGLGCAERLSTVNGQFECQQDCSRVSLSLKEVLFFFLGSSFLGDRNVSGRRYRVPQ